MKKKGDQRIMQCKTKNTCNAKCHNQAEKIKKANQKARKTMKSIMEARATIEEVQCK